MTIPPLDSFSKTSLPLTFTTVGNYIQFFKENPPNDGELKISECSKLGQCGDHQVLIHTLKECLMNSYPKKNETSGKGRSPMRKGIKFNLITKITTILYRQRARLEKMLRSITPERYKIAEIMIFSIEHSEAIQEICQCIKESLSNPKTSLQKKISRLFVISDVLYNCTAKGMNAIGYRKGFKVHLPSIFQEIHYAYQTGCSGGGASADCFKERVMGCCRAWDDWGIYPSEFLIRLQNIFLGLLSANSRVRYLLG